MQENPAAFNRVAKESYSQLREEERERLRQDAISATEESSVMTHKQLAKAGGRLFNKIQKIVSLLNIGFR